jgi:mannitol 2-dehydrogenase
MPRVPVLSAQTLPAVAHRVAVPTYDRSRVRTGIVHLGVGGFHRAHLAMYADQLLESGHSLDWGICGVGVLASDVRMRDVLRAQDGLYTLVLKDNDGSWSARVIGSIVDYLLASDDPEVVIERMASPETRIVSLTITEGGYNISAVTGEFDPTTPAVVQDLAEGAVPSTTFGLVTEALRRRRDRGLAPFTVLSCDNIENNGQVAQRVFTAFASLKDAGLGGWVEQQVRFPNTMVDRITPATTDDDRSQLQERLGIDDGWPVVCEPFTQWVVEDAFPTGRPEWEAVGAQLVDDVEPYELMKLRLLNGGHQALCYAAYLAGYRLVHEACQDPLFAGFLRGYMEDEATPTLSAVPGVDLDVYKTQLITRFSNAGVRDTVARLCAESSDRIPKFLLPVLRHHLAAGGPIEHAVTVIACWARYAEAVDERGEPIEVVDQLRGRLMAAAARQHDEPLAFVSERDLFGDLVDDERFVTAYLRALRSLRTHGVRATLEAVAKARG